MIGIEYGPRRPRPNRPDLADVLMAIVLVCFVLGGAAATDGCSTRPQPAPAARR